MKQLCSIPLLLYLLVVPAALAAEEPVDWEMVTRIRDEGFNRSQVMETLRYLTDTIGPRLTGSPALKEANEWTRDRLEGWGLENAQLEEWGPFGRGWSFSRSAVHMLSPRQLPIAALPKGWTPGTDGPVTGTLIRVEIESEEDFEDYKGKLEGKILLVADSRAAFGRDVFRTEIPINIRLAEAPGYGKTIFDYQSWSKGAQAYAHLGAEVIARSRKTGLV